MVLQSSYMFYKPPYKLETPPPSHHLTVGKAMAFPWFSIGFPRALAMDFPATSHPAAFPTPPQSCNTTERMPCNASDFSVTAAMASLKLGRTAK